MDTQQIQYVLQELQFSAELPASVLEPLAAKSSLHRIAAGKVLFREGSENANLYLVRSGRIAIEMNVPGRGAVRILTLGPGEVVGWSALLGQGNMTATALAVDDAELIAAAAEELRALSEANHDFGYHLMQRMASALSRRLLATRLQLLDLFGDAPADPAAALDATEADA